MTRAIIGSSVKKSIPVGPQVSTHKIEKSLVITNVKVIEVEKRIEIPVPVVVEYEIIQKVYKDKIVEQAKYETKLEDTIRYVVKEEDTKKYVVVEVPTEKFIPKDVEVERPVIVDKEYERPVLVDKEYEILRPRDLDVVRAFMAEVPKLIKNMNEALTLMRALKEDVVRTKVELDKLKKYVRVEEVIKVPKIEYVNTQVERIVWKDVIRERPVNAN